MLSLADDRPAGRNHWPQPRRPALVLHHCERVFSLKSIYRAICAADPHGFGYPRQAHPTDGLATCPALFIVTIAVGAAPALASGYKAQAAVNRTGVKIDVVQSLEVGKERDFALCPGCGYDAHLLAAFLGAPRCEALLLSP